MRTGAWSGLLRTRCRRPVCLLVAIFVLGMLSPLRGAAGPSRDVRAFSALSWVRTDPLHPRLLYAGGYGYRASYPGIQGRACLFQAARSLDGGATWQDLARSLPPSYSAPYSVSGSNSPVCGAAEPFIVSPDGTDVFYRAALPCVSPDSCVLAGYSLYHSGDAGLHWGQPLDRPELDPHLDTGTVPEGLSFSPLDPRLVVVALASRNNGPLVVRSADGGSTWRYTLSDSTATADGTPIQNLIPGAVRMALDPTSARVVYLGYSSSMDAALPWLRSADGGHTWHLLVFPVKLPQDGATLGADPRLPGLLVARLIDPAIPLDRRYVSADHGGTWRAILCPGDLRGECPSPSWTTCSGRAGPTASTRTGCMRSPAAGRRVRGWRSPPGCPAPRRTGCTYRAGASRATRPTCSAARRWQPPRWRRCPPGRRPRRWGRSTAASTPGRAGSGWTRRRHGASPGDSRGCGALQRRPGGGRLEPWTRCSGRCGCCGSGRTRWWPGEWPPRCIAAVACPPTSDTSPTLGRTMPPGRGSQPWAGSEALLEPDRWGAGGGLKSTLGSTRARVPGGSPH